MLTAVTIDSPIINSLISHNFGRCAFFILFDEEKNSTEILQNPFANTIGTGAGIQLAQLLIEKNVDSVITKQIGLGPLRLLISADIKVYQCSTELNAGKAVELLSVKKLQVMDISSVTAGNSFGKRYGKNSKP
jgi:predicted Fe-Mo cluster-binding NifX family protein